MTKFRVGIVLGFAGGYYLGARAGRERYAQLNRMLRRVQRASAFGTAVDKARAVVDLSRERVHVHVDETEPLVDLTTSEYRNN